MNPKAGTESNADERRAGLQRGLPAPFARHGEWSVAAARNACAPALLTRPHKARRMPARGALQRDD